MISAAAGGKRRRPTSVARAGSFLSRRWVRTIARTAAAMYSNHGILTALRDGAVGIVLMLLMYKIYDLIDRRDFARELADGNTMLGMELEGLFILLSAVIVGAMKYAAG